MVRNIVYVTSNGFDYVLHAYIMMVYNNKLVFIFVLLFSRRLWNIYIIKFVASMCGCLVARLNQSQAWVSMHNRFRSIDVWNVQKYWFSNELRTFIYNIFGIFDTSFWKIRYIRLEYSFQTCQYCSVRRDPVVSLPVHM